MKAAAQRISLAILAMGLCAQLAAQDPPVAPALPNLASQALQVPASQAMISQPSYGPATAVQLLLGFRDSDVKFDVSKLMDILRDRRHEGWVLAAYPDPKTERPLIGAGFSLDLPKREHPQRDPLNQHPFVESSSADLWQAAGLAPGQLQGILAQFHERASMWSARRFRAKVKTLEPDITDEEADRLLRIGAIQAIENARAYCRNFDQLSGSQQMALSQLVYQMGVNLEEFSQFLTLINSDATASDTTAPVSAPDGTSAAIMPVSGSADGAEYWTAVQQSLMHSQWARLYRTRAVAVIAMLDPSYDDNPVAAELRVSTTLRPAAAHRRGRRGPSRQLASGPKSAGRSGRKRAARTRSKQTA